MLTPLGARRLIGPASTAIGANDGVMLHKVASGQLCTQREGWVVSTGFGSGCKVPIRAANPICGAVV